MKNKGNASFQAKLDREPSVRIIGREVKGIAQNETVNHDWTANKIFDCRPVRGGFDKHGFMK